MLSINLLLYFSPCLQRFFKIDFATCNMQQRQDPCTLSTEELDIEPEEEVAVHEPAECAPDTAFLTVAQFTQVTEPVPEDGALRITLLVTRTTVLLDLHDLVKHKGRQDAQSYRHIRLYVDRGP